MTSEVKIQLSSPPLSHDVWDSWQKDFGSAFHSTPHMQALEALGWQSLYAAELRGSNVVATATAVVRHVPGSLGKWSPFAWSNIFAEPSFKAEPTDRLIPELLKACGKSGASFAQTSGMMGRWTKDLVDQVKGARPYELSTLEIDLSATEDALLSGVHSKHRNSIRSAEKAGVQVSSLGADVSDADLDAFYQMLSETLTRGETAVPPRAFVVGICKGWLKNGFAEMLVARSPEGKALSYVIVPFTKKRAHYWLGASVGRDELPAGTGNLLQWRAILAAKRHGTQVYNTGIVRLGAEPGSKLEQIQKFKERFGGKAVSCYTWNADIKAVRGPLLRMAKQYLGPS